MATHRSLRSRHDPTDIRLLPPVHGADFAALREDNGALYELQEGSLVMSPRPTFRHSIAITELWHRVEAPDGAMTTAADVHLVVEIVSLRSIRTDTKIKPVEYADAGIPNFWLIEPEAPGSATIFRLVNGRYEESQRAEGTVTVTDPYPLTIDLTNLRGRSADRGQHR